MLFVRSKRWNDQKSESVNVIVMGAIFRPNEAREEGVWRLPDKPKL